MRACPVCGGTALKRILEIPSVPVFCNIQLDTREEALAQPTGAMHLDYCPACSHVFNSAFDPELLSYSESYENSLHFSATFSRFADELARRLVREYGLEGKTVIDIGCGKGDFLSLICELGGNSGHGFDKSYEEGRARIPSRGEVRYYKDFFSSDYADIQPDLVTCRHVLEHIPEPAAFLDEIVSTVANESGCTLYFEVPNLLFTIRDMGVWDLIYEHCQYFSPQSLAGLFAREDVVIERVYDCFGRQFLGLEARTAPADDRTERQAEIQLPADDVGRLAADFETAFRSVTGKWEDELAALDTDASAVVWGAGSKGTTFLNLLDSADRIAGIVDINPNKQGKFVPCTGHPIVAPEALADLRPHHVYIMNPMYRDEIAGMLRDLGVKAEIHVVE